MRFECKDVATLFFFEQRAVQDHGVARVQDGKPGRAALAVQSYAVRVHRCGLLRMGRHAVAAARSSNEKGWVGGCCVCVRVCVYVYVVRLVGLCGGSRYWEVGLLARSCPLNVRGLARC